jgi:hypothetical protein
VECSCGDDKVSDVRQFEQAQKPGAPTLGKVRDLGRGLEEQTPEPRGKGDNSAATRAQTGGHSARTSADHRIA